MPPSEGTIITVIAVSVVVIAIVGVSISFFAERRRREALSAFAAANFLTFGKDDSPALKNTLKETLLWSLGRSQQIRNEMTGQVDGVDITVFDFTYMVGGGRNNSVYRTTVLQIEAAGLPVDRFVVRPKKTLEGLRRVFSRRAPVTMPDDPAFTKAFTVFGDAEPAIQQTMTLDRRAHLLALDKVTLEMDHGRLLFYRDRKRVKPDKLRAFIDEGIATYHRFARRDDF